MDDDARETKVENSLTNQAIHKSDNLSIHNMDVAGNIKMVDHINHASCSMIPEGKFAVDNDCDLSLV